jgi:hypothetical protein
LLTAAGRAALHTSGGEWRRFTDQVNGLLEGPEAVGAR